MRRLLVSATALAGILAGSGSVFAADHRVAPDGTVHSVAVETWKTGDEDSIVAGTAIRYVLQAPSGARVESVLVPGTNDVAIDRDPVVGVGGSDGGRAVVVWSRSAGDRLALFASRRVGGEWSPIRRVCPTLGDAREPEIRLRSDWVHLSWSESSAEGLQYFRCVLDAGTLDEVHGPELLAQEHEHGLVPPEGEAEAGTSPEPGQDLVLTGGAVLPSDPGDPGKIFIWGVRDEPIPIDYLQGFLLPDELDEVLHVRALRLGGQLTLSFQSGGRLYYTQRRHGRWTDLRAFALGGDTTPSEALLHIKAMIETESQAAGTNGP